MSADVTDPYNWSVSPTRRAMAISRPPAATRSLRPGLVLGLARFEDFAFALDVLLFPAVAGSASFRGSR